MRDGFAVNNAYHAGWEARYAEEKALDSNHHDAGTLEWWSWKIGWLCADESEREMPSDPVGDVIAEVQTRVRTQEAGYQVLVDRVSNAAQMLADMLAMRAPVVLLNGHFRPLLKKRCKDLLAAKPPAWRKEAK